MFAGAFVLFLVFVNIEFVGNIIYCSLISKHYLHNATITKTTMYKNTFCLKKWMRYICFHTAIKKQMACYMLQKTYDTSS